MTRTSCRIAALAAMLHVLAHTAPAQTPLGTAFTYQGRLTSGEALLSDTADFQFSLWDASGSGSPPTGGNQIGPTLTFDGVGGNPAPVTMINGLFAVLLDFGTYTFVGDARWLQIEVRHPPGSGSYTILSPRQQMVAVPYALGVALPFSAAYAVDDFQTAVSVYHSYGGDALFGASNTGVGVRGSSSNVAIAADGGITGVAGNSTSGTGVAGISTNGTGVSGSSTGGRGVYGAGSTGVYGEGTTGVYGAGTSTGMHGVSSSSTGRGVFGEATSATGTTYGGRFESSSPSGVGVYGKATGPFGSLTYGVIGVGTNLTGYGVFSYGELGASGPKSFRVDHPRDPENKYLLHYSIESPEVLNLYSGKVTLDERGEAVVRLPDYFAAINKDPRYTLTAIGAPMPNLHVSEEIDETALSAGAKAAPGQAAPMCSFRIAGGAPGKKVSWRVEALRNDKWVQQRGAPVEVEKQGLEKGTYQHPEFYGQPAEKSINYHADAARPEAQRPSPPLSSGTVGLFEESEEK